MDAFLQLLTEWGYVGMFISAFLAGTILPFSSEAVLLACVGLGEWIEKYLRVDKKQMDRAERFIRGRGSWMALFSFLPVIGDAILIVLGWIAILIVLGWMRANVWIVALSMTIGKLARYAILVAATLGVFKLF